MSMKYIFILFVVCCFVTNCNKSKRNIMEPKSPCASIKHGPCDFISIEEFWQRNQSIKM